MSEELKPCPCGAPAEKEPYAINAANNLFRLDCTRAECGWCVVSPTIEQAFIDWNTRAELSAIKGVGEAIPVGKVLSENDQLRSDGKSGPVIWFGRLPPDALLYTRPPVVAEAGQPNAVAQKVWPAGDYGPSIEELGALPIPVGAKLYLAPPASGAVPVHLRPLLGKAASRLETQFDADDRAVGAELRALLAKGVV